MTKITFDCRKAIVLGWNGGQHGNGRQASGVHLCSKPALLLDDVYRPAHKVCAQSALAALINERNERTPQDV
jgi:hypothetical protein